jgi:hypothetical protein
MIAPAVLGALLDDLADRIAVRINTRAEREAYDSRHLPPRCSRRRFAEVCRSGRIADVRREGRDWTCSRDAWEAARSRRPAPAIAPTATPREPRSLEARADALLAKARLRVVNGTR